MATAKKERQKLARRIRKVAGKVIGYTECFSLARAVLKYSISEWANKRGYKYKLITLCSCCGPEELRVKVLDKVLVIPSNDSANIGYWYLSDIF